MDHPEEETNPDASSFDFNGFPADALIHDRREGRSRRRSRAADPLQPEPAQCRATPERRIKKERRRRIDPTTFEKQYSEDEMEFMNAMQQYKVQTGKAFPSHGEVLRVAFSLGYRKWLDDEPFETSDDCNADVSDAASNDHALSE